MNSLLRDVEEYLVTYSMAVTRFGMEVSGDTRLVSDMRNGRTPGAKLRSKIIAYMADEGASGRQPKLPRTPVWDEAKDHALWQMVSEGTARRVIAKELGLTLSAIHNRINRLAEERLPDRAGRLVDVIWRQSGCFPAEPRPRPVQGRYPFLNHRTVAELIASGAIT
ncbi:hypothetical protein [uncultured Sphingomonas sp.]|uniref:hypothetical protein n=1 Tax=uncultured Sphingomonas sp. TaxID=158754 RepID=UPI0025E4A12D|nr:hypothetical protein [uncultured Sphingomonas sp.]